MSAKRKKAAKVSALRRKGLGPVVAKRIAGVEKKKGNHTR